MIFSIVFKPFVSIHKIPLHFQNDLCSFTIFVWHVSLLSDPENERAISNMKYFEDEMKEKTLKKPKSEKDLPPINYDKPGETIDV